jgi:hypothetical protein
VATPARSRLAIFDQLLALVFSIVLIVPLLFITAEQGVWLRPFVRDFIPWLERPKIAGGLQLPDGALYGGMIEVAFLAIAWILVGFVAAGTEYEDSLSFRLGLTLIGSLCIAGYIGMCAVIFGVLERPFVLAVTAALAGAVLVPAIGNRHRFHGLPVRPKGGWWAAAAVTLGAIVTVPIVVHAALAPVTEWDAIIYHAAAAKLWFLEAPNPSVVYGPSVGIEISGNYPPLFPAGGATFDTIAGGFADIFLRLASPLSFVGLLLLAWSYASRRIGSRYAVWTVGLLIGCPLLVLYATWTTGYLLLTSIWLAAFVLCDIAARTGRVLPWAAAGVLVGVAVLTHFYGLPALAIGPFSLVLARRSSRNLIGVGLQLLIAGVVASPWLLRNAIVVHDPLYPLSLPPFHPIGLIEPMWSASQAEIKNNALGQWSAAGVPLIYQQAGTVLFERHLLAVGMLFGLLMGIWFALRGDRWATYVIGTVAAFLATLLAPGWFWMRALIVIVPLIALLTTRGIAALLEGDPVWAFPRWPVIRPIVNSAAVATTAVCCLVGASLSVAGPNQSTWTTLLDGSQNDMMAVVRNLGSNPDSLYNVFGGDYLSWTWLNENLGPHERVATLDNRLYYFDRPQNIFYLDGIESGPLVSIRSSDVARQFLRSNGVTYVMIPGWASSAGPTQHPAIHQLPLVGMLGDSNFPIAAVFVDFYPDPTIVYSVGPYNRPVQPAVYEGQAAGPPPSPQAPLLLRRGDTTPRIIAPVGGSKPTTLHFEFLSHTGATLDVNEFNRSMQSWVIGVYRTSPADSDGSWHSASVPLNATSGYVEFGLFATGGDVSVSDVRVEDATGPVFVPGSGSTPASAHYQIAGRDTANRLMVPAGENKGVQLLSFEYLDSGGGHFDLNYFNPRSQEWTGVTGASITDTERWLTVATEVAMDDPFSEYAIFDDGPGLTIRSINVSGDPVLLSPNGKESNGEYLIPPGNSAGEILVPMPAGRSIRLTITYVDDPGSFGINVLDASVSASWKYGKAIMRSGRGESRTVSISLGAGPTRIVQVGLATYRGQLGVLSFTAG